MLVIPIGLLIAGALMIVKGGDVFVDAAGWVSDATGISKVVIGATIVSLATTSPEYIVSTIATLKGFNDLSIGNAVGSLICNITVAFSLLAIFSSGLVKDKLFGMKGFIMIASTTLLWAFCLNGVVSVIEGAILLAIFIIFTFLNIRYSKDEIHTKRPTNSIETAINIAKFIIGGAAIVMGSNLIVDNAQIIAVRLGVPPEVVGLTVVAIGTSLPEIVTSIAAILKKQNALSIGNIIGANILDATLILSTGAFISGGALRVSSRTVTLDLPIAILVMLLAVVPTAIGKRIYRWQGVMIAAAYAGYLVYIAGYSRY